MILEKCRAQNQIDFYSELTKSLNHKVKGSDPFQKNLRAKLREAEKILRELTFQVNEVIHKGTKEHKEIWLVKKKMLKYFIKEYKLYNQKVIKLKESEIIEDEIQNTTFLPQLGDKRTHVINNYKKEIKNFKRDLQCFVDTLRKKKDPKHYKDPLFFDSTAKISQISQNINENFFESTDLKTGSLQFKLAKRSKSEPHIFQLIGSDKLIERKHQPSAISYTLCKQELAIRKSIYDHKDIYEVQST